MFFEKSEFVFNEIDQIGINIDQIFDSVDSRVLSDIRVLTALYRVLARNQNEFFLAVLKGIVIKGVMIAQFHFRTFNVVGTKHGKETSRSGNAGSGKHRLFHLSNVIKAQTACAIQGLGSSERCRCGKARRAAIT